MVRVETVRVAGSWDGTVHVSYAAVDVDADVDVDVPVPVVPGRRQPPRQGRGPTRRHRQEHRWPPVRLSSRPRAKGSPAMLIYSTGSVGSVDGRPSVGRNLETRKRGCC